MSFKNVFLLYYHKCTSKGIGALKLEYPTSLVRSVPKGCYGCII